MIDVDRVNRVMAQITEENLDMNSWAEKRSCGTTMCFAGHTVAEAGIPIWWKPYEDERFDEWTGTYETVTRYEASYTEDGRLIQTVAKDLLGFNEQQADYVFLATHIHNDVDMLWDRVNCVLDGGDLDDSCGCEDCN